MQSKTKVCSFSTAVGLNPVEGMEVYFFYMLRVV